MKDGEETVGPLEVCTYVLIVPNHGRIYTYKPTESEIQEAAKRKAAKDFGQGNHKYRFIPIGEESTETPNFTCRKRKCLVIKSDLSTLEKKR